MKRFLLLVLIAILCCAVLAGCGEANLSDFSGDVPAITLNGEVAVTADEYLSYLVSYKEYYGDAEFWSSTDASAYSSYLISMVDDLLIQRAILLEWASDLGITLSEEEIAQIDGMVALTIEAYGSEEAYAEALNASYMTPDLYYNSMMTSLILSKWEETVYRTDEVYRVTAEDCAEFLETSGILYAKHILIKNDTGEDPQQNRRLAEDLLARLMRGEDFDTLMNQYTEDPGIVTAPEGYLFFEGEMVESFEAATQSLEYGEISGIVESEHGYHIILRLEPTEEDLALEIRDTLANDEYQMRLSAAEISFFDGHDSLNITEVNWPYAAEAA